MQKLERVLHILRDCILNFFSNADVILVTEDKGWVIQEEAKFMQGELSKLLKVRVSFTHYGARKKTIHFLSVNTLVNKSGPRKIHQSNEVILSWLHVEPKDRRLAFKEEIGKRCKWIHTLCSSTKKQLISAGFKEEKIVIVPQAIDTDLFYPQDKKQCKEKLGIDSKKLVIASFQKDGIGFGEGTKPKKIKGPDTFLAVAAKLKKDFDIHVLLTGPARGYVKAGLDSLGIPYTHDFLEDYKDLNDYYGAADLYIVASRIEGGPKAILESWATKTPVVSTRVGLVPDIYEPLAPQLVLDTEDQEGLYKASKTLLNSVEDHEPVLKDCYDKAKSFSWESLAKQYQKDLYQS